MTSSSPNKSDSATSESAEWLEEFFNSVGHGKKEPPLPTEPHVWSVGGRFSSGGKKKSDNNIIFDCAHCLLRIIYRYNAKGQFVWKSKAKDREPGNWGPEPVDEPFRIYDDNY